MDTTLHRWKYTQTPVLMYNSDLLSSEYKYIQLHMLMYSTANSILMSDDAELKFLVIWTWCAHSYFKKTTWAAAKNLFPFICWECFQSLHSKCCISNMRVNMHISATNVDPQRKVSRRFHRLITVKILLRGLDYQRKQALEICLKSK